MTTSPRATSAARAIAILAAPSSEPSARLAVCRELAADDGACYSVACAMVERARIATAQRRTAPWCELSPRGQAERVMALLAQPDAPVAATTKELLAMLATVRTTI